MTIITNIKNNTGIITLNRQDRYNAIDLKTINDISSFLLFCRENNQIKKIIISSNHPKAFCAGGDIRMAHEAMKKNDQTLASTFFKEEYSLVYALATYPKPIISIIDGLCYGGGMGLTMHNKVRVITENAVLGMPETIIGFFPDVGSSFRFSKFSKAWANFYAFTGGNIALSHALKWDMADYFIPSFVLTDFIDCLCNIENIQQTINEFSQALPVLPLFGADWVDEIFSLELKDIFIALKKHKHPEAEKTLGNLLARSPLSLLVTDKLLKLAGSLSLKEALETDYFIAANFLKNSDFEEGVRAQVIDKDKSPKWTYTFHNINEAIIKQFFSKTVPFILA